MVENRYPLVFGATVRGEAIRFTQRRKTRLMGLSESERISMIRSAVLIESTRVTDGRNFRGIYALYAVARKNNSRVKITPIQLTDAL